MPFEQLHIFQSINLCIQAPYMKLEAIDYVFPCCTSIILQFAQSRPGQTRSYHTLLPLPRQERIPIPEIRSGSSSENRHGKDAYQLKSLGGSLSLRQQHTFNLGIKCLLSKCVVGFCTASG
jgi:hypothetical protein